MLELLKILLMGAVAYSLGSISFSILITRWKAGIDVRSVGSGHAGATNTMRTAGWIAGILVLVLDVGKGYLAVWLAQRWATSPWGMVVAAGMVVVGHCWPIFAGFRGGMGMASGGGALLAIWPLGFVLAVGAGALSQLVVRHSARANVLTGVLVIPLWALFGVSAQPLVAAAVVGILVSLRALSDWYREYRELWWDRG
jgi:glycerol-3-phosphate acyltransferase PlsY